MVAVTEEVYVGQRRSGLRHGQGRISVANLLGQNNAKPFNYWLTINLLSSIENGAADTDPCLCGCKVLLKEENNGRRGEVDCLANAERSHVRVGGGEIPKEVSVRVLGQHYVYCQVCGDVEREPDLMEARGLPIYAIDGAAGDVSL